MKRTIITFVMVLGFCSLIRSQSLTLDEVLQKARNNAIGITLAKADIEQVRFENKLFKASLRPQVGINLTAPDYFKSSVPVVQPDGIVSFTDLAQNNASIALNASQIIPWTGGRIFVNSDLRRFDDYPNDITAYNGTPISFGIVQPIFGFNATKYNKRILKAKSEETLYRFHYAVEDVQFQATLLYFDILIANVNRNLAENNLSVNENLLRITNERLQLGKASKNDQLQLQMEVDRSKLEEIQAQLDYENAVTSLNNLLQTNFTHQNLKLDQPSVMTDVKVNEELAIQNALLSRPELLSFYRQNTELEAEKAEAKTTFGWNANLTASFGYARGAANIYDIYNDPQNAQTLQFSVSVPIIDWGRKKAAMGSIQVRQNSINQQILQQKNTITNEVKMALQTFIQLHKSVDIMRSIQASAAERFEISNERYILGNISLTDLTLAQRENDQAKRNYITTLRDYWATYYQLRTLTGYDPVLNQEIKYSTK